jgi:hypothetical protein
MNQLIDAYSMSLNDISGFDHCSSGRNEFILFWVPGARKTGTAAAGGCQLQGAVCWAFSDGKFRARFVLGNLLAEDCHANVANVMC